MMVDSSFLKWHVSRDMILNVHLCVGKWVLSGLMSIQSRYLLTIIFDIFVRRFVQQRLYEIAN